MSPILQAKANGSAFGYGMFVPAGAAGAFESIATTTLTTTTATVTFSSIPSTYQSLQIRTLSKTNVASIVATYIALQFNSDSGNNYTMHLMGGDGSTVSVNNATSISSADSPITGGASASADTFGAAIIDIHDYGSTSRYKTIRSFSGIDNNGSGSVRLSSGLWLSTSAVTSITLINAGSFVSGSTFALYGIKGA